MVKILHRIRYPPFESTKLDASKIPVVEYEFDIDGPVFPPFQLGNENSWLVERIIDGDFEVDTKYHGKTPQIIEKQRTGWYMIPHPIHAKARKAISITVIILLSCLFYLFTTPLQTSLGIPTFGTGKIRLGLLDYPVLVVIVVPLMIAPIILRVGANLRDLRRQKFFLKNSPPRPNITIDSTTSGDDLCGEITIENPLEEWKSMFISWRVGILPPARHKVFSALGLNPDGQPPPGLTTQLPHHWEEGLDDGTGMGEDAPMERHDAPGGVFLRPMRIMSISESVEINIDGGRFKLKKPKGNWPGTVYGGLVRVHWEMIVNIQRDKGGPLLWVEPLVVDHQKTSTINQDLQIFDGRSESDTI
tara:strand:+ start:3183 stop:4262 length:1080 start_codon:yes stop_codon:yes gene_type:complete